MSEKHLQRQLEEMFSDIDSLNSEPEVTGDLPDSVGSVVVARTELVRPTSFNPNGRQHLVTFRLDEQIYALPIEPIIQIFEMVTITPIPQLGSSLDGVINVHGAAVPVLNVRRHFGMPKLSQQVDAHIILVQFDERKVGLLVDEVLAVLDLNSDQIIPVIDILPDELGDLPLLQGLVHTGDSTVLLFDLAHLLQSQPGLALAEIINLGDEEE